MILPLLIVLLAPVLANGQAPAAAHSKEFWKAIAQQSFAVPAGQSAPALAAELSELLGSPDPELRDDIAYTTLAQWMYSKRLLSPADIRPLMAAWTQNLTRGVGTVGGDGIFRRSFSALMLSVVIARDNADPFLSEGEFRVLFGSAITYLAAEKDVRGYDPATGWMHSAAHTADLLKFLLRSRFLTAVDQKTALDAIAAKMAGTPAVFTHGEDERHARAILSIVRRTDFDADAFKAWVTRSTPKPAPGAIDPAKLHGDQNVKNLFSKLEVLLSLEPDPPAPTRAALEALRAALKTLY